MIPTPNTDRKYRTHEALSLASLLVALAVTNLLWGLNVTEYNPLVEWALSATSWTAVAIGGLAITAAAFSLLRWADRQYGTPWFGRLAIVIGAVSVANAANDAWILYRHSIPETFLVGEYATFLATAGLAAGALFARYEIISAIRQVPASISRRQARALGLAAIMVLSLPAMFMVSFGPADHSVVTAQEADGPTVFVGEDSASSDTLYAVDADDGSKIWSKSASSSGFNDIKISDDGTELYAADGNTVFSIDAKTGDTNWRQNTGTATAIDVGPDNSRVFVAESSDDEVTALDAGDGSELWTNSLGTSTRAIAAGSNNVYAGANDDTLYAFDVETGTQQWSNSTATSSIITIDISPDENTVYAGDAAPALRAHSASDGSVSWTYSGASDNFISLVATDSAVYSATNGLNSNTNARKHSLSDGSVDWSKALGSGEGMDAVGELEDSGSVFVGGSDAQATELASSDGSTGWQFTEGSNEIGSITASSGVSPGLDAKVVDVGGEPIEGASIDAEGQTTGTTKSGKTGSDGTVTLTFDQTEEVEVTAETSIDSATKSASITEGYPTVTIELTPGDLQVVDQDGEPVSGATVIASGPTNTSLDADIDDAEALRQEAKELLDEISGENVRPDNWDPSIDISDEVASGEYTVAHTPDQWQSDRNEFGDLREPVVRVEQSDVILSNWDTEKESGIGISRDPVNKHLPGETTDGDIKVEQLSPSGEVLQTKTLSTYKAGETIPTFSYDINEHRIVRTYLPKGNFYRISPARGGNGYILAVGNPEDFVSAWVEDVETEAGNLMDRAQRIENLIDNQELWYERSITGSEGEAIFGDFPSDVEVADVRAFKGPGVEELVEANESGIDTPDDLANLSLQDIREMRNESIFEGDIFITERKRIDSFPATIEGEWVSDIPNGEIPDEEEAEEIRNETEDVANETKDEIAEYGEKFKNLIEWRDRIINNTQDIDGFIEHFESEYPEYVSDGEYDFPEPESVEEAEAQVEALRDALSTWDGTEGGDIDEEIGDIEDALTKVIEIPDRVDGLDWIDAVEISYEDEDTEQIGEEYLTVENRSESDDGFASTVLVIDDYEPASENIEEVSVSFQSPYNDVNSTVGESVSTLTTDIDIPSDVQQLADIRNVTIEYNDSSTEAVPKANQTLFTDNDTLRIDSHPVDDTLTVENVVVEFAEASREVENVTFIGNESSSQRWLNTTVEVSTSPENVTLTEDGDQDETQAVLAEIQYVNPDVGGKTYDTIPAQYVSVADDDNDDNAELTVEWPVPDDKYEEEYDSYSLSGLEFQNLSPVSGADTDIGDDDLDEGGTTIRYVNTTLSLSNSYGSLDEVTPVRIHYAVSETEKIPERYLSLDATSNDLTIDMYEVGSKRIQYIEVTGNNSNTEIINDTQDVTELNESLQGRIKLDASPASVNDVEAVAYWQNGDVEEIPNTYLELEPAIGTMEVVPGDPGSYLLVDGYPTLGRDLDRIDVSIGETNATVDPIEGGQFLNAEVSFEDGLFSFNDISEEDVTILAEWQDGETTRIPQQYWEVDGELTGVGKILINDYPIPEDKVAGNIEVIARAGDEIYRVSDRVESPTYGGESADVEYVSVSNLEPATGEVVQVRTGLKDEVENVELTNATIVSPRGNTMDATINDDSTVSFPAGDGPGTYRVDLIFKDTSEAGDIEFERSVPIEATNERRNHPPVVHEMSGGDQSFAFVGALEAGDVERDPVDETTTMTAIIERGADPPSVVHYHPSSDGVGSGETYALEVRQGEDRQTVRSHVSAVVHVPLGDNALVYRQGNKPLTTGGTSFGELDKDNGEVRTYTNDQGEVTVRVIQDPGVLDRAVFSARTIIYDLSLPVGLLRFGLLTLLSTLLLSRRRVGEVVQSWT